MTDLRTVLCYGDSNTHGTMPMAALDDMGRHGPNARWPGVLAAALGAGWRVIDEGHPGRTTCHDDPIEGRHKNGMTVLPAVLESHRPIDLVVLMLGTNDLKARFSVTGWDIASAAEGLARFILASDCGPGGGAPAVLIVAPPPIEEVGCLAGMFEGGRAKSLVFGREFAEMARRIGVPCLDAGAHIAVDPADGIHYAAAAQVTLGRAVATTIAQHWP
jgi:lysophospholipase L1-like esterase